MQSFESAFETIRRESDLACSAAAAAARREITGVLNQFLRRLRQYGNEDEWISAVLDGAAQFSKQVSLFTLKDNVLELRAQQNLFLDSDLSFPVGSAGAFATAVASKDPVVALRSTAEVSAPLSSREAGDRAQIVPVLNGSRVVAVLFAIMDGDTDLDALEFVAGVASAVLERSSNVSLHSQIAAAPPVELGSTDRLPDWADLNEVERNLHMRAQRFARVAVADLQLSHPQDCQAGRDQSNLYMFLSSHVDKARDAYRKSFMHAPSMVDYLHLELVRIAAEGDESKLGADYPGKLSH